MNRGTRRVEFIQKQQQRASTFMKRRSGILKKAHELAVLCGVDACVIIKAPKENENNDELLDLVWSSSSDSGVAVQELIKRYKKQSVENRRIGVYNVSKYYEDKKRKAENMLASLKKKNREASKVSTWNSMFESMKEHELRDLANDLDIKIDNLKSWRELMRNKRIKTTINSSLSSHVDQQLWRNGENDLQLKYVMEPSFMNPMAMKFMNQMQMISIEDKNSHDCQAINYSKMKIATDLIDDDNNYYLQPIAMTKPDVNPTVLPTFDHDTPTDSEPQFFL